MLDSPALGVGVSDGSVSHGYKEFYDEELVEIVFNESHGRYF